MQKRKYPLALWIFIGLLAGIAMGLVLMTVNIGGMTGVEFGN